MTVQERDCYTDFAIRFCFVLTACAPARVTQCAVVEFSFVSNHDVSVVWRDLFFDFLLLLYFAYRTLILLFNSYIL